MKQRTTLATILVLCLLWEACNKKNCPIATVPEPIDKDPITYNDTYRNDVPPPPTTPWRDVDTTRFDTCERYMWKYTKNMYPINDTNYWDYKVYALMSDTGDIWKRRANESRFTHFFQDTITRRYIYHDASQPCGGVDTSFFLQTIGPPTCRQANGFEITYYYVFKLRDRNGPCPWIFDAGAVIEWRCYTQHFEHCADLRINFSQQTGKMHMVVFFGAG